MQIRKQTTKLVEELISLRNSRKSADDFNFNFLINFYEISKLMNSHLKKSESSSEELKLIAHRQYFVFLVSCWETFFRDFFIYIHSKDEESISSLMKKMNIYDDSISLKNITLPELLSKSFNFQNIMDIESAFNTLWGSDFFNYVCNTETGYCGIGGEITKSFSINNLFSDWDNVIKTTFDIRHKVIHDANFRPEFDALFIQKAESLFLIVPQLVTYFLIVRFDLEHVYLSHNGVTVPSIFTIHDILGQWQEVRESKD
ncbi:HEPN domain-containing protein [Sulfuricurvum sp.]|uniref:HEPN domain-containing protein n=1 Tax=Sulfuricurvum sp. TaxID=2025608 RepID=UPI00260232F4|nr:HEPN domain-containing protein [Sulfuricurvum sp.]MDD4950582.1 hypothetical protein [Sulfuricurvum sp.]